MSTTHTAPPRGPAEVVDTPRVPCYHFVVMYAVIEAGGKQHRVTPGQVLEVDRLPEAKGSEITLGRVLMLVDGGQVTTGTPVVPGVRVAATVVAHPRGRKVVVGKFRPKKRYRRRVGHRQPLTRVRVDRIEVEEAAHGA